MTSADLGPLNETAQAVRVMKEKYMLWQQRLDSLVAQVSAHLPLCPSALISAMCKLFCPCFTTTLNANA